MAATRNIALNEMNFRGLSINAATNTITIVPSDSGIIFLNQNTSNSTNYNLPAVADGAGKFFWFFNAQTSQNMVITAPANTLMADDVTTANTLTTAANNVGYAAMIFGDGTNWFAVELGALAWTTGT